MPLDPNALPRIFPQGETRSKVTNKYALLTPDTFVPSVLPGWRNTRGVVQISRRMGDRGVGFLQYEAYVTRQSASDPAMPDVQRLVYVLEGQIAVHLGKGKKTLGVGGFAYLPPNLEHRITSPRGARVLVFEKIYEQAEGVATPEPIFGDERKIKGNDFQDDPMLKLKLLLPDDARFDMAVNIFDYQSGGALPQVEIHVMEHGLLMLAGAGIYRLGSDWFPVRDGDVIWMAPYCEQWFVAMGKTPARYIYYKDVNRYAG